MMIDPLFQAIVFGSFFVLGVAFESYRRSRWLRTLHMAPGTTNFQWKVHTWLGNAAYIGAAVVTWILIVVTQ
jgi:hypothetical protein